jgi:hypothetical protein
MAHRCPECGQVCHCRGDIDDCLFGSEEDIINCIHFLECERDFVTDYYDEDI